MSNEDGSVDVPHRFITWESHIKDGQLGDKTGVQLIPSTASFPHRSKETCTGRQCHLHTYCVKPYHNSRDWSKASHRGGLDSISGKMSFVAMAQILFPFNGHLLKRKSNCLCLHNFLLNFDCSMLILTKLHVTMVTLC